MTTPSKRHIALVKMAGLAIVLGGLVYFFRFTTFGRSIQPDLILQYVEGTHPVVARLSYVVIYILGTVLMVPGTLISFAGAVLFGVYEGTLYTWAGASIGATLAFLASRWLGRGVVESIMGQRLATLDRFVEHRGFWGILLLRLLPIFPFNLINFGSGLTRIRLRDYVAATMIGILPGTFVYQLLFAKLGRRALEKGVRFSDLLDPEILWSVSLFVAFLALGMLLARRFKSQIGDAKPADSA